MKTIQTLIVFCVFSLTLKAQVSFNLSSSPGVGNGPFSVTAADVNGDGKVDLISVNYYDNTISVLTNNGNGGFVPAGTNAVGSLPTIVTAADVNGDGKVDLITVNGNGNLSVLTNNGSGRFVFASSPGVGNSPTSVTAADVNGDGKVDLISANRADSTVSVLTNNGSGSFVLASLPVVGNGPESVTAADVNGDGKVDLITANWANGAGNTLTVLTNNGSGGFVLASSPVVGNGPFMVVAADVNGDGKIDLICANWGGGAGNTLTVLTNNGSGIFGSNATISVGNGPICVAAADINGDGKLDLISANNKGNSLTVLTNNGSGGFVLATNLSVGSGPNWVTAVDVNGDGKVDLISANGGNKTLSVLTNATVFPPHPPVGSPIATGIATTNNGFVVGVTVTYGGYSYTNTPQVRFIGGGGSGAQAVAVVSNGVVTAIQVLDAGSGYTNLPLVLIDPPFIPNPILSVTPMSFLTFSNLTIGGTYQLQQSWQWYWTNRTSGFMASNAVYTQMVAGAMGSGNYRLALNPVPTQAFATPQVVNGFVVGATVTSGGSGYVTSPAVSIIGGHGTNATAVAYISGGVVTSINIISTGTGYTNTPTIEIAPPPAAAVSPAVFPVIRVDSANLAPYYNYQVQYKPDIMAGWINWNGGLFSPTDVTNSQFLFITNNTGFFRLQFMP